MNHLPFPDRRGLCRLALAFCGMLALNACSGVFSGEHTVHVDGARLQQRLESRFPVEKRLLGMFNVTLSNPRLSFDAANNQLGTQFTLAVPSMLGMTPALKGTVALAYGLRYDSTDNSVRMTQVQVKAVDLKDEQGRGNDRINSALAVLGQQAFQDYVLYKLTDSDLAKVKHYQYVPTSVTVRGDGLDVLLTPKK